MKLEANWKGPGWNWLWRGSGRWILEWGTVEGSLTSMPERFWKCFTGHLQFPSPHWVVVREELEIWASPHMGHTHSVQNNCPHLYLLSESTSSRTGYGANPASMLDTQIWAYLLLPSLKLSSLVAEEQLRQHKFLRAQLPPVGSNNVHSNSC